MIRGMRGFRQGDDDGGKRRKHGLRIGLVSNGQRDLDEFARHHGLDVDVCIGSLRHGRVKPHRSIFEAALGLSRS